MPRPLDVPRHDCLLLRRRNTNEIVAHEKPSVVFARGGLTLRLPLVCREGRIPLARSHRVREGSVGEGVSPALDASWTEARADLPVKAESKCCSCCSQAVAAQQLYLRRPGFMSIAQEADPLRDPTAGSFHVTRSELIFYSQRFPSTNKRLPAQQRFAKQRRYKIIQKQE